MFNYFLVHPIFWFLVTFADKVMKIQNYYAIFVYILQGNMDKREKNGKKILQLLSEQNTKNQKTKIWDEQNICYTTAHFKKSWGQLSAQLTS